MDNASLPWLNPHMRSSLLALCGLLLSLATTLRGQATGNFVVVTPIAPYFIVPPVDVAGAPGERASLSATVGGAPTPGLQWRKSNVDIPGANAATLTFEALTAADAGLYELVATNIAGNARSLAVALTVARRAQTIAFEPGVTEFIAAKPVLLSATASSGLPVTFGILSGQASLSGATLTGTGRVTIRASQAGNTSYAPATSVDRTFTFVAGATTPILVREPGNHVINSGGGITLRAAAVATPAVTYRWSKDGVSIAGATGAEYAIANATVADTGRYTVTAANIAGSATASGTVTVQVAPNFTTAPSDQIVSVGTAVTLRVSVSGVPAPTLQWRKNGTVIPGATRESLNFASVTAADAGRYDVIGSNVLGAVTSSAATLTVNARNVTGTYVGQFSANAGDFALLVRSNGTAVFLGHLPGAQTGVAATDLRVDAAGNFSLNLITLASELPTQVLAGETPVAAAPRPVTLRGNLNDTTSSVAGTIPELNVTFQGIGSPAADPTTAAAAGFYQVALVGTAAGRGYAIVAPDGEVLDLTSAGTVLDSARGRLGSNGRLTTTSSGQASVDLGFANGAVNGTVRTASGASGSIVGAAENLLGQEHIVNLSVRTATSNAAPLITGFVVSGTATKDVLIRAAGPALLRPPFSVASALANPALQLFRGNAVIGQNDDWGTPAANVAALNAAVSRTAAFPFVAGSADAALLMTLTPGPYTVLIGGGNGEVLAEVYEVLATNEAVGSRRLVNVAARGLVSPGNPLIAGFVISGTAPQRVLIRGVGPRLAAAPFDLGGVLANPLLTLFRENTPIRSNDDWFREAEAPLISDAANRAGAFALGPQSLDASMVLYLQAGAYTAQVSGPANANAANGSGIALVEIYESTP